MFTIDSRTGQLSTKAPLDFENKPDDGYWFHLVVRDGKGPNGRTDMVVDEGAFVRIEVGNVDEPGTVTLDWSQPQVSAPLTATLTDLDGGEKNKKWQWARSDSNDRNGSYTNITTNATSATYTPVAADNDKYLQVTVTYTDVQGADKTAENVSALRVRTAPQANTDPAFSDDSTTRGIPENTPPGVNVGNPVTATDLDQGDSLRYTLSDTYGGHFNIHPWSGRIKTKAPLDHEVNPSYNVTVTATDTSNATDTIEVTINVTDVPMEINGPSSVDFSEGEYVYSSVVAEYDIEPDSAVLTLTGRDARHFSLEQRRYLHFNAEPDYEAPGDSGRNNVYDVTINAAANINGTTQTESRDVRVTVTNYNEGPVLTGPDAVDFREHTTGAVARYTARDPENDPIRFYVQGTDDHEFFRISRSGVLTFKEPPDYEEPPDHIEDPDNNAYRVVVVAMSGLNFAADGEATLVTVTDSNNDPPVFRSGTTQARAVPENTGANSLIGTRVLAKTVNGGAVTYSLSGTDASSFNIDPATGQLKTKRALNYEAKNRYSVTVRATQGGRTANAAVSILITNEEEKGTVSFRSTKVRSTKVRSTSVRSTGVRANTSLTATLSDPDGGITNPVWQWQRSSSPNDGYTDIPGATSATYTPVEADIGQYLRVTVTYTDGHGSGKKSQASLPHRVQSGPNRPPQFPDQDTITPGDQTTQTRKVEENTSAGENIGAPVAATDADSDTMTYSLSGRDAASFAIVAASGQLQTKSALDYERKNSYTVRVRATDTANASSTVTVTINVTNADDAGAVTLSSAQSWVDTALTATLADPDGSIANPTWSWEISTDNTNWAAISGAASASYTPVATDVSKYLRAKVTYTDGHGSGKNALSSAAGAVQQPNRAPAFPDQDPNTNGIQTAQTRAVAENTAANTNIGAPVAATDADSDTMTYSLSGKDAASSFAIVAASGQLQTKAALDYEAKRSYTVTVRATDPANASATVTVTINVTDVDEAGTVTLSSSQAWIGTALTATLTDPDGGVSGHTWSWEWAATQNGNYAAISGAASASYTAAIGDAGKYLRAKVTYDDVHGTAKNVHSGPTGAVGQPNRAPSFSQPIVAISRQVVENTAANTNIGAPVAATDADNHALTYSLAGTDAISFAIVASSGQLQTKASLDYETKSSYTVMVTATDAANASATVTVNIQVTDVEEAGTVTLSSEWPRQGTEMTAVLTDSDGGVSGASWQWGKSSTAPGPYTSINGATSASYTPVAADVGKFLMAAVGYTDRIGPGKTANAVSANAVQQPNRPPAFPDQDPGASGPQTAQTRTVNENTAAGVDIGAPVAATDQDGGDVLTYSLGGTDAASFAIVASSGQLQTEAPLDYETKDSYAVTVTATDTSGESATATVTINVTDVDEYGVVTLSSEWPRVGAPFTATLDDPDAPVMNATWVWEITTNKRAWSSITGRRRIPTRRSRRRREVPECDGCLC